jgi:hypothetical protein
MADSFADLEGVKAIPVGGLNERTVKESIPLGDFSKLIGLRQNQVGELVRYPGEQEIDLGRFSSIRGLFPFGDYLIVQTEVTLVRVKLNEVFTNFPQVLPELFPDNYAPAGPTPPAINPELMSYALVNYELASGNAPAATLAATWNKVPINVEEADSANRISISGANVITITAGAYPAWVRIDGECCVTSPLSLAAGANSNQRCQLRLKNNTTLAVVANGVNMRETTANAQNEGRQVLNATIKGRFQIAASTDFILELFTSEATSFGRELTTGQPEIYAQLEIVIEE